MRITIDVPDELFIQAQILSGKKSKRAVLCWALKVAVRKRALEDLRTRKGKIKFDIFPDEMEAREIRGQRNRNRLMQGRR